MDTLNEKNVVLHIFSNEKFVADYINRVNRLFDKDKHVFYIHGKETADKIKQIEGNNVIMACKYKSKIRADIELIRQMKHADRIIFHSIFFSIRLFLLIIVMTAFFYKKYFWNIWGADLYDAYRKKDINIFMKIKEIMRKYFIAKVSAVGYIPGDYDFLKKHYKTKARFYLASYTYDFIDIPAGEESNTVNILIGNSANPSCQYHEAIEMLAPFKHMNIKVWCVLAYPHDDMKYIDDVIKHGTEVLGDKFIPLTDYMVYEDYMKLLSNIDIAILNNNRQQALGNIASLLFYGKRVFINPLNACGEYFKDIGAIVYSTEELNLDVIKKINPVELKRVNQKVILDFFSDDNFYRRWNKIFDDKWN